jgi:hypothetical protein
MGRVPTRPLRITGAILAVAAAAMLLARLPGAYHALQGAARAAAGRNQLGGALATADAIGLNDDFVTAAFVHVPENGRFAVVLPKDEAAVEKADGVNPITFDGVSALFADYLLPRRQLETPAAGSYLLCFYCDAALWSSRTHWIATTSGGGRIGYVYR